MTRSLDQALQAVDLTYQQVEQIAYDVISEPLAQVNEIIQELGKDINEMSIDMLRTYMLKLQLSIFQISEIKDKSVTKAQCAEALRKEAYSVSFLKQEGSVGQKEASATIDISDRIIVEYVYDFISALIKTKVDQGLRLVDTLKSVLMSRMQEVKLNGLNLSE